MTTATGTEPPTVRNGALVTLLRAPWSPRAWLDTAQVVLAFPIALVAWTVVVSLGAAALSLAITAVLAIPFLVALYALNPVFAGWQRARIAGFRGIHIPAPPAADPSAPGHGGRGWVRRLWATTLAPSTWRQLGYHLLAGFTATIGFALVVGFWTLGGFLATIAIHGWALPTRTFLDPVLAKPAAVALLTVLGVVMVFAAPWVAYVAAQLDAALAAALLAPSRTERLARQVVSLSESRAEVIDAADSERRRIERDLHDGTQQRLVSLAMNLGITRTTLTEVPAPVREAIEQAHEEAKLALSELRDVVRGMHPAVLDDLGLDAALSGIAARSPVPVRLMVELPRRLPAPVETVAYFVVSEALSNVAKHAQASRVDIIVEQADGAPLRIIVSDDGHGGADPNAGTGLRGLRQRIGSVDGTMRIDSPPGGPTLLIVELPCAS